MEDTRLRVKDVKDVEKGRSIYTLFLSFKISTSFTSFTRKCVSFTNVFHVFHTFMCTSSLSSLPGDISKGYLNVHVSLKPALPSNHVAFAHARPVGAEACRHEHAKSLFFNNTFGCLVGQVEQK